MNVLALLAVTPWLCQSPLELGSGFDIINPVTFTMAITEDGQFEAFGTERENNLSDFAWQGSGILHEGQFRMIGKQSYTASNLPQGELRARTVFVEKDVFILDVRSSAPAPIMVRCLPEPRTGAPKK